MQSQQKRVKWSRGETAEALEERTDTGITQASVELMENCIPDIYGNISRRPGLSLIPLASNYNTSVTPAYIGFEYDAGIQYAVFYITEDDFIICGIHTHAQPEFIRIKDGKVVCKRIATDSTCWNGVLGNNGVWTPKVISYAQQNNYMIVATAQGVYKIQLIIEDQIFGFTIEPWKFSAGWYATEGTKTRSVTSADVAGLNFAGGFTTQSFTDNAGITTSFSVVSTGVNYSNLSTLQEKIPEGSIIQLPNAGCYFRIEGYSVSSSSVVLETYTFDNVLTENSTVPATGTYCKQRITSVVVPVLHPGHGGIGQITYETVYTGHLEVYVNGQKVDQFTTQSQDHRVSVKNTASSTGMSLCQFLGTSWSNWVDATNVTITAYGALLTPVADDAATDSVVTVEYGYTSLMPDDWEPPAFPHPKKLVFNSQRLWAGGWAYSLDQEYSLVIGSQIARYNDFKNDYNLENEPITLDILTQFKEKIVHLVDYNGLKIFTDAFEYAYQNGGLVKQSSNGAWENCTPIVFESLCLYIDGTGNQVKAMQYEFQSNIFNSSSINQLAPHDLVWFPYSMAAYEDKIHSTGKYLFLVNKYDTNIPRIAVCNFVPGNQANIWSRWTVPDVTINGGVTTSLVDAVIYTKTQPIFMLNFFQTDPLGTDTGLSAIIYPAVIDFDAHTDLETAPGGTEIPFIHIVVDGVNYDLILPYADVAVYANGEFQWTDTLDATGHLTKSIEGLTNVTAGLPINATIRSHPIDVGGKTKSIKKRIGKAQMSVHDTEPGVITINGKTGYMNPAKDHICFYGVTGMKDEIKYTITNNNGGMFHLESLLMNIEYGTLIS